MPSSVMRVFLYNQANLHGELDNELFIGCREKNVE